MRLLFHDYQSQRQISPFVDALTAVAATGQLLVACPYIGLSVLGNALASVDRFRIVTDLDAWLTIVPAAARHDLADWWQTRRHAVRHQSMLHAKVFIGSSLAFVGSANCTDVGFTRRVEMGVLFDEVSVVAELTAWFEQTWERANELDEVSLAVAVAAAPIAPATRRPPTTRVALLDNAPPQVRTNSHLSFVAKARALPTTVEDGDLRSDALAAARVADCLRQRCVRQWATVYFEWLGDLIRATGVTKNSSQLTTTLIHHDRRIGVNVNNRSSLAWDKFSGDGRRAVYYLLPSDYAETLIARFPQRVDRIHHLKPYSGEQSPPVLLIADFPPPMEFGSDFRDTLLASARTEIERARLHSPQGGRRHVPLLFDMALDQSLRDEVFDLAFG